MDEKYNSQEVNEKPDNNEKVDVLAADSNKYNDYPPKPVEENSQQSLIKSLLSVVLFIAAFYLVFKWEISFILILAGVLFIHELGHFLAMRMFKYKDLSIFFVPLLGAPASGTKDTISQKQRVIILLAGPVPGVIIGLILYYVGLTNANEFLLKTSNIFIFLNLFNLLPIIPLDGGKLIKTLFFDSNELINKIFLIISIVILTYIALDSKSYFFLIVPFLLIMQINSQAQTKKIRDAARSKGLNLNKSFNELTDEEYWLIRDEIAIHNKYFSRIIFPKRYIISDREQQIIKQVKSIAQKQPLKDLGVGGKILITLFWVLTFIVPLVLIVVYYIRLGLIV